MNTNEIRADNSVRKNKFWSILKKVILYTLAAIAVVLALVILAVPPSCDIASLG